MARKEKISEKLRYTFTDDEKRELAETLALACQKKEIARDEKKAAMADFGKRINVEEALIGKTSRDLNNGWELRDTECIVEYHVPSPGMKRITRADTGELVREVAMDLAERQENLFGESSKRGGKGAASASDAGTAHATAEEVEANAKRFFEGK